MAHSGLPSEASKAAHIARPLSLFRLLGVLCSMRTEGY